MRIVIGIETAATALDRRSTNKVKVLSGERVRCAAINCTPHTFYYCYYYYKHSRVATHLCLVRARARKKKHIAITDGSPYTQHNHNLAIIIPIKIHNTNNAPGIRLQGVHRRSWRTTLHFHPGIASFRTSLRKCHRCLHVYFVSVLLQKIQ